jgi:hypothetical protein
MSPAVFLVLPPPLAIALLCAALAAFAAALIALGLGLWNLEFPPLRAKGLGLSTVSLFSSLLFYAGLLHALGLFAPSSGLPALTHCFLWQPWLMLALGLGLFNAVLTLRLYTIYHLFRRHTHPPLFQRVLPSLAGWLGWLGLGLAAFFAQASSVGDYDPAGGGGCASTLWWKATVMALLAASWLLQIVLVLSVRSVIRFATEVHELLVGVAASLVGTTAVALALFTPAGRTVAGATALLILVPLAFHAYFWTCLGAVLYGTLFHREHTLRRFILDLQQEGSEHRQAHEKTSAAAPSLDVPYKQMLRKQSGVGAMGLGMSIGAPELNY